MRAASPSPARSRLGLVATAALLAAAGSTAGARPATAQLAPLEVRDVRFVGNETFPADSLARAIATRKTDCRSRIFNLLLMCPLDLDFAVSRSMLRERDLPRDRARLVLWYRQRGFRDVQVDTPTVTRTATRAEVAFRVREGRPVIADSIAYVGAEGLGMPGLLTNLPIRAGERLSTLAMDATRDSIVRRLANRGHAYADVFRNAFRPADDPYNAVVTFEIVPGPVTTYGTITVNGTQDLSPTTVLRTAQLRQGDTYRRDDIDQATARLYGLDIVRSASVVPDTLSAERDTIIDVQITLQEGDAYRVRAGGGWSTAECLNLEARWTSRNFMGGGRLLQVRGRVGNLLAAEFRDVLCTQSGQRDFANLTGLASVDFVQPWIFSTRNSLSTSVYGERQSLPDVFIRRAVGVQVALSRSVSPQTVLTGFFRPEVSQLTAEAVLFCTGFLVCTPEDVDALSGSNWLSPVGFSLARDRSDDLLNPRRGYRFLIDFEHAARWTGSDFRYDRVVAETSRYYPLGSVVFASRLRGGWVGSGGFSELVSDNRGSDIVHPQKRFYTGGANSVRGFAQSRLGPRVLVADPVALLDLSETGGACAPEAIVDRSCVPAEGALVQPRPTGGTRIVEANAELRFPLGGFLEGVVFTDVGQAWGPSEGVRLDELEFTPGFGVRFPSPVGPIRLDLAYRFRGAQDLVIVTEQIRPWVQGEDPDADRLAIRGPNGQTIRLDWVTQGDLVPLQTPFRFGVNDRGFQLHVSIGQAF